MDEKSSLDKNHDISRGYNISTLELTGPLMSDEKSKQTLKGHIELVPVKNPVKEHIKVLVVAGPKLLAHYRPNSKEYTGLLYDIFKEIKSELKEKYVFEETFKTKANYNKMTEMVRDGIYDMVVGPFQYTSERMKIVDYTSSIVLSKDSILYYPKTSYISIVSKIMVKVVLVPLIILIILGYISGYILYRVEGNRTIFMDKTLQKYAFRRVVATTTAALFGEAGFLSENSTLTTSGLIITFSIMAFAFFFVMFIQGFITERLIYLQKANNVSRKNIDTVTLLSPKGYAVAKNFERLGAQIVYKDDTIENILKYYEKNKSKYDGVSLDYMDARGRENSFSGLVTNKNDFGFKEIAFIVNKSKTELKNDLNLQIIRLQNNLFTEEACDHFLDDEDKYLCVM